MEDFRSFLDDNELIYLNLKGNRCTWSNKRIGAGFIQRRLDRMAKTQDWLDQYLNSILSSMSRISSDHRPIELKMEKPKKKKSPFKFENMWMAHEEFKRNLLEWWKIKIADIKIFRLAKKMNEVKNNLKIWNIKVFQNVHYKN